MPMNLGRSCILSYIGGECDRYIQYTVDISQTSISLLHVAVLDRFLGVKEILLASLPLST